MSLVYADDWLTVHQGDCRAVMAEMPAESVHCVVTSPPYWGLRDYGDAGQLGLEPTPEEYVGNLVAVFREVRRVLRSDGTVWLNLGDTYSGGRNGAPGPQADAKHRGRTRGWVPPQAAGGADLPRKNLIGIPWRVALALQADGWLLRCDVIWAKGRSFDPTGAGSVLPEAVTDRPSRSHEYIFLLTKGPRYYYGASDAREESDPDQEAHNQRYAKVYDAHTARATAGDRQPGNVNNVGLHARPGSGGRNYRSVWCISPVPYPGDHPATFPVALVEPMVRAGCPVEGTILDPFAGTGTVGVVANSLSRRAVLIDLNADYLIQAMGRNRDIPLGLVG